MSQLRQRDNMAIMQKEREQTTSSILIPPRGNNILLDTDMPTIGKNFHRRDNTVEQCLHVNAGSI
eukprot:11177709-Ditylum_brightwellii.AAC.1